MDIHSIQCFRIAYEVRSLGKAAEQIFLSRQALSRTIKNLETEIKQPLFIRSAQGLEPTELARGIYPKVIDLLTNYEEVCALCFDTDRQETVRLCVAYGALNSVFLEPFIKHFKLINPAIKIDLDVLEPTMSGRCVSDGTADLALIVGTYTTEKTRCLSFGSVPLYAAIHKSLLPSGEPLTIKSLVGKTWFGLSEDFPTDAALMAYSHEQGLDLNMVFEYHDYPLILDQVLRKQGACLVPESYINQGCPDDIATIPLDDINLTWEISVILPTERALSKSAQAAFDALKEYFS